MTVERSLSIRLASLLLAASFLFATGPEVFGLLGCPYHGADGIEAAGAVAVESAYHGHQGNAAPATSSADRGYADQGSSDEPCGWLADCHVCCVQVSPRVDTVGTLLPSAVSRVVKESSDAARRPLGPRHGLFELHLPNAPPSLI